MDIYPEETIVEKDSCTPMFITALFTIAKTWKQPRCPLTKRLQTVNVGEGVEKRERYCPVSGNAN